MRSSGRAPCGAHGWTQRVKTFTSPCGAHGRTQRSKKFTNSCSGAMWDLLVGLVVKASVLRAADPLFNSGFLRGDFSASSHTGDFKFGSQVATLPGARR